MLRAIRAVGWSLAVLLLVTPVLARGTITGHVIDREGNVLHGVEVVLSPLRDASLRTYQLKTNKKGVYTIPADNGDYKLTVENESWGLDAMKILVLNQAGDQVYDWQGRVFPGQAPVEIGVSSGYRITVDLVVAGHAVLKEEYGRFLLGTVVRELESGNAEAAAGTVEKLLAESPDDPVGLTLRAYLLMEKGNQAGAEEDLDRALGVDPDYGDALFQLAGIYLATGREKDALDTFIRTTAADGPDDLKAKAWVQAGEIQRNAGDLQAAIDSFSKASSLSAELSAVLSAEIAGLYTRLGQDDLAEQWLAKAGSAASKDPALLYNIAVAKFNEKAWEEAAEGFKRVIAADNGFADAYRNLGYCLLNLGDRDEAADNLRKYLELVPDAADAAQIQGLVAALSQ